MTMPGQLPDPSRNLPVHVLVVDDDARLRALLRQYLTQQGFFVTTAADTREAEEELRHIQSEIMVLDIMMPGESGTAFAKRIRASGITMPMLLLTAMGEPEERIRGLEAGVDDYLTKPFEPKELLLRMQAILRRTSSQQQSVPTLKFGDFDYDPKNQILRRLDEPVHLTTTEQALLDIFAARANSTIAREALAGLLGLEGNERAVDVQVNRLRRKIEPEPRRPVHLQTVRGEGYMLKVNP